MPARSRGPILQRRPAPDGLGAYDTPMDVAGHLARYSIVPALLEAARAGCPEPFAGDGLFGELLRREPGRYVRPERCADLLARLGSAAAPRLCELVMDHADLQRLAEDGLARWPGPRLALAFWNALERLTVLDPTCGSGAFLLAAAAVLEPLYAACLARMELLAGTCPEARTVLDQAAAGRRRFVLRSILQRNLHGVELRAEAAARCRERLGALCPGEAPSNLWVGDAILGSAAADEAGQFHWQGAFPAVMAAGGFDVILGNPPYARVPRGAGRPLLRAAYWSARPKWSPDENLATLAVERCLSLLKPGTGHMGLVLPLAVACSTEPPFATLRRVISAQPGLWLWSHFDRTPNALFGREVRTRCTLALVARSPEVPAHQSATTGLLRWTAPARPGLFATLRYARLAVDISAGIPKVASQAQADVLEGLFAAGPPLGMDLEAGHPARALAAAAPGFPRAAVFVGGSACNWFPAWREVPPTLDRRGRAALPARTVGFSFGSEERADLVFALLCSSLGYWWWAVAADGFNLKKWVVLRFPLSLAMIPEPARLELAGLGRALRLELRNHPVHKDNRGRIGNFMLPACGAETLAIDRCLGARVPGLSAAFMDDIRASNAAFARSGRAGDGRKSV